MTFLAERDAALSEAKAIARAELARRRPRLGELTHEQEMGVENLIMSTVTKLFDSLPDVRQTLVCRRKPTS